jgi:uncharacterized membrane protein YedE/YeeE
MLLKAIIGLSIGLIFGYTLQRAGISKYPRVTGMLMLKDFKILKFMLTAVISSMIGFHLLGDLNLLEVMPKDLDWGKVVGGLIFGLGMGTLGYCPGTLAVRIGEGKKEALLALVGTALGIFLFGINAGAIKSLMGTGLIKGDLFVQLGVNKWLVIIPAAFLFGGLIYYLSKRFDDSRKIF